MYLLTSSADRQKTRSSVSSPATNNSATSQSSESARNSPLSHRLTSELNQLQSVNPLDQRHARHDVARGEAAPSLRPVAIRSIRHAASSSQVPFFRDTVPLAGSYALPNMISDAMPGAALKPWLAKYLQAFRAVSLSAQGKEREEDRPPAALCLLDSRWLCSTGWPPAPGRSPAPKRRGRGQPPARFVPV